MEEWKGKPFTVPCTRMMPPLPNSVRASNGMCATIHMPCEPSYISSSVWNRITSSRAYFYPRLFLFRRIVARVNVIECHRPAPMDLYLRRALGLSIVMHVRIHVEE